MRLAITFDRRDSAGELVVGARYELALFREWHPRRRYVDEDGQRWKLLRETRRKILYCEPTIRAADFMAWFGPWRFVLGYWRADGETESALGLETWRVLGAMP